MTDFAVFIEVDDLLQLRLELVIGDLRSPAALGINTDDRPLGLRLSRIDLAG